MSNEYQYTLDYGIELIPILNLIRTDIVNAYDVYNVFEHGDLDTNSERFKELYRYIDALVGERLINTVTRRAYGYNRSMGFTFIQDVDAYLEIPWIHKGGDKLSEIIDRHISALIDKCLIKHAVLYPTLRSAKLMGLNHTCGTIHLIIEG